MWVTISSTTASQVEHLPCQYTITGFDISKKFHLPDYQNFVYYRTFTELRRKLCQNPLAQLAVLLAPGYCTMWMSSPSKQANTVPISSQCCHMAMLKVQFSQKGIILSGEKICLNSLWPSAAIWWQRSQSTMTQVMACCLLAPSHYLNQC